MMRIVMAATAVAVAISSSLVLSSIPPQTALSCTLAPYEFERDTQHAAFVALVEAVAVGSATNSLQPLPSPTASPTYAAPATDTPVASATRTPRGAKTATPTATATATWTPAATPTWGSLAGIGATLAIVTLYAGEVASPITIDAGGRASYERFLREREALLPARTSCDGMHPAPYAAGARYVVFGGGVDGAFSTYMPILVDGDDAVFGSGGLSMREASYHRYFEGLPAEIRDGAASLTVERMPLATLARAIVAARRGAIVLPETGSAGLARGR